MRTPRLFPLLALLAAALLHTGCASLEAITGGARPSASVAAVDLGPWSLRSATLFIDLEIANPYVVPMPLTNLQYELRTGDRAFAAGRATLTGVVPARGQRRVRVPLEISLAELLRVAPAVKPGAALPWTATMTLAVDAPGAGAMTLPLSTTGELRLPGALPF